MKRKNLMAFASAAAIASLALTGCTMGGNSSADSGSSGTGTGVDYGSSKADFQAALADMDEVTLKFQVSSPSANSISGQRDQAFADAIGDWSGGKIKVEVIYANAVVAPDGISDALADGRLDLAHWLTSYHKDEMPAFMALQDALVAAPSSPLQGEIVTHFAAQEVAFDTPEIMAEFEEQGMTVLNPLNTFGSTAMACTDEKNALSDFSGTQIRVNAAAQVIQSEAMGASTVSLQLAETYEGLQRNVIQCTYGSMTTMVSNGWIEQASNVYLPTDSTFGIGSGSIVAGSSWSKLPLAAQQLIFDQMSVYNVGELGQSYAAQAEGIEVASKAGSGMHFLAPEISAALAAGNEKILEGVQESSQLDGPKLVDSVRTTSAKWTDIANELGYKDEGEILDFADWYEGNGEVMDHEYLEPVVDRFFEEVLLEHRPA
ncbi:hypothetical protein CQ017_04060 [Arthrobacter sp. MYb224]|uniref:hypothetical protein n=1 Tax=Micrococcaceae TaxID=1268 RepID=UPI000CFB6960|nr:MULTISPECIES: hypothetical protein [unclassified Arthrobacter]PRA00215.1 hypothetical protein CQ017_04060 [Arthrobacter sp. MYb224]PRA04390.1 hypothetical protein CQ019_08670 [Arthrobacter sp. MYb229]PRB51696.1 hypothetical protein CQ013_07895 [Arthrobacter sp. MYb216]